MADAINIPILLMKKLTPREINQIFPKLGLFNVKWGLRLLNQSPTLNYYTIDIIQETWVISLLQNISSLFFKIPEISNAISVLKMNIMAKVKQLRESRGRYHYAVSLWPIPYFTPPSSTTWITKIAIQLIHILPGWLLPICSPHYSQNDLPQVYIWSCHSPFKPSQGFFIAFNIVYTSGSQPY